MSHFFPIVDYYEFIAPVSNDYTELVELIINSENPLDFNINQTFNLSGEKYHVVKRKDLSLKALNKNKISSSQAKEFKDEPRHSYLFQDEALLANEKIAPLHIKQTELFYSNNNASDRFYDQDNFQPIMNNQPVKAPENNEYNSYSIVKQSPVKKQPPLPARKFDVENQPQKIEKDLANKTHHGVDLEKSLLEPIQEKLNALFYVFKK